jgi:hypothetical protein
MHSISIRPAKFFLITLVLCSGCAVHQPLLVRDQDSRIKNQGKRLRNYGDLVQDKIKTTRSVAVLVISSPGATTPPAIYPTQDPVATAAEHDNEIRAGSACFVVFDRELPVAPEQLSCTLLAFEAAKLQENRRYQTEQQTRINETRSDLDSLAAQVSEIRSDLNGLVRQVSRISDEVKQEQETLGNHNNEILHARADINSLGQILGPTTSLVTFHEAQLKLTEKMLTALINDYKKSTDVIGQNNQQIDGVIKDLNAAFAQVKTTLDQMQQRLSTVK